MQKAPNTRAVTDMRHYNDQNPNSNPARTRGRAPQLVREPEYMGQLRTIIVRAPRRAEVTATGRENNGAPLPIKQAVGGARKYE